MQVESNIKPNKFKIEELRNGKVTVLFFDNMTSKKKEKVTIYKYDMYKIVLNNREKLIEDIEENYNTWLQFAKNSEYERLATEVRYKRDNLLNQTDWTQVTDSVLSEEKQQEYKEYRQQLRDITIQENFPYDVVFPEKPKESEE